MQPSSLPFGERRLNHRISCSRIVQVNDQYGSYSGHIKDLALGGAFIAPSEDNQYRIGQELVLNIPFRLKNDVLTIKAKVAWSRAYGTGVRFIHPITGEA